MELIDAKEVLRRLDILSLALGFCNVSHANDARLEVVKAIREFIANQPKVDVRGTDEYKKLLENAKFLDDALREYQKKYN